MPINRRMTNRRLSQRWWECARCGFNYPESQVVRRKGMVFCSGPTTKHCGEDEYGAGYFRKTTEIRTEAVPEDPPEVPWDDD